MYSNIAYGALENITLGTYYTATEYQYKWNDYDVNSSFDVGKVGSEPLCRVSVLKFSTPSFSGTSKYLKLKFENVTGSWIGDWIDINLRFSLCVSDANRYAYTSSNNYTPPSDNNRIAYAETSVSLRGMQSDWSREYTDIIVEIKTNEVQPNSTYFLIIQYTGTQTSVDTDYGYSGIVGATLRGNETIIEVGYNANTIHIDNGVGHEEFYCYISNGTTFELYLLYVDTGTAWECL